MEHVLPPRFEEPLRAGILMLIRFHVVGGIFLVTMDGATGSVSK